jgi:hypothetical protein
MTDHEAYSAVLEPVIMNTQILISSEWEFGKSRATQSVVKSYRTIKLNVRSIKGL